MTKLFLSLAVSFLASALTGCATDGEKAPMPQTRGMQGMDPEFHDAANQATIICKPKAGTESMAHAPKDHPMPDTRGMHGMDPALHMRDCHSSNRDAPVTQGPHQHKGPNG